MTLINKKPIIFDDRCFSEDPEERKAYFKEHKRFFSQMEIEAILDETAEREGMTPEQRKLLIFES